jgi:pilus assembly protein CpaB
MRLASILIVVCALLLAGAVFVFVPRLMNRNVQQAERQQAVRVAAQDVLVAAKNLPAGTVLKAEDVRWQRWPEEALDPSFQVREKGADPQKVAVGFIVLHGIEAGQPVTPQRLLKPGESGFLAAVLTPGMRAVTMRIDAISAEAGFILPLDRVDIVLNEHYTVAPAPGAAQASQNLPQVGTKDVSSVILRNVKVLAIDQGMQDIDSKPRVGATATLEVDLQQAQKISIAGQLGTLSLVLRSHTLPTRSEPEGASPIVEDYQVSPFRAAVMQQLYSNLATGQQQAQHSVSDDALHVYHGAALAGARP